MCAQNSRQSLRIFYYCVTERTACCIDNNRLNRPLPPPTHSQTHTANQIIHSLLSSSPSRFWKFHRIRRRRRWFCVSLFNCETCSDDDIVEIFSVDVDFSPHVTHNNAEEHKWENENAQFSVRSVDFHNCENPTKPQRVNAKMGKYIHS